MTLIELLVVLSIITILLGMGIGVYGTMAHNYAFNQIRSEFAGLFREARTRAIEQNSTVTVTVDPADGSATTIARGLIGVWHFEAADRASGASGYLGSYSFFAEAREIIPITSQYSRFGQGIWFPYRDEKAEAGQTERFVEPKPELRIPDAEVWNPPNGVGVEMYLNLSDMQRVYTYRVEKGWTREPFRNMRYALFHKGSAYAVSVRADYSLLVEVNGLDSSGVSTRGVFYTHALAVPAGRWFRLTCMIGPGRPTVAVDQVDLALTPTKSSRGFFMVALPRVGDPMVIGDAQLDSRFAGRLDELRIFSFTTKTAAAVPGGYKLLGRRRSVRFDERGFLDSLYHKRPVVFRIADDADDHFSVPLSDGGTEIEETLEQKEAREARVYETLHDADKREVTIQLSGNAR